MRRLVPAVASLVLLLGACADTERDPLPGFDTHSGVLAVEEMRIDGYEADLVPVTRLRVAPDGRIAVVQPQDAAVRVFSAAGELLTTLGGRGEGPGEFVRVNALGWKGDSLWVYDSGNARITWYAPDLRLASTRSQIAGPVSPEPDLPPDVPNFPFVYPSAITPDGAILAALDAGLGATVPERLRGLPIAALTDEMTIRTILTVAPPGEGGAVRSQTSAASVPYGNRAVTGFAPDGSRVGVAMATLDGPEGGTVWLSVVDSGGQILIDRRFPFEPDSIPEAEAWASFEQHVTRMASSGLTDLAAQARREWTPPPVHPPLRMLRIGLDGSLWLQKRNRDERPFYRVLTGEGEPVGSIALPEGAVIGEATLDRVWLVERDEFDMPSIVRYTLEWEVVMPGG